MEYDWKMRKQETKKEIETKQTKTKRTKKKQKQVINEICKNM